jgi:hypothetical protein
MKYVHDLLAVLALIVVIAALGALAYIMLKLAITL